MVELPKTYFIVRLWTSKSPFVSMSTHWEEQELASGKKIPAECTIWMERGVSAGGRVLDDNAKPVVAHKVQVQTDSVALATPRRSSNLL